MKEYKLLITGTMGAGKTTAIRAISDIEPIVTDVVNHDKAVAKLAVDVRERADVVMLIDTLLGQIEAGMAMEAPS